jgi:transposase
LGSKHHLLVEGGGIPLAWALTGGNRHDSTQLIPLVDRVPPVGGKVGRPRRRPDRVTADRAYDYPSRRRELRQRGIKAEIARRNTEHGSGLGRNRWVVERTFAWLHQFKRLLVRFDRRADIHEAFLALGCCLVCYRRLRNSSLILAVGLVALLTLAGAAGAGSYATGASRLIPLIRKNLPHYAAEQNTNSGRRRRPPRGELPQPNEARRTLPEPRVSSTRTTRCPPSDRSCTRPRTT